jgi:hypothetical protein
MKRDTGLTEITVGDKVETAVFIGMERKPMSIGIVVSQSADKSLSDVDIMSLHGGAPWVVTEATIHLRKVNTA